MTTADRVDTPIDDRAGDDVRPDTGSMQCGARTAIANAWHASSRLWRVLAFGVAAAALASTTTELVPLASGAAVALLVPAALVDRHERRLPDGIVALAATAFAILALTAGWSERPIDAGYVALGIAVAAGPVLALHLLSPTAMGFGDVKTTVVLGAALGAVHWQLALTAVALAAGMTATAAIATRARTIAFGPGLIGAAAMVLVASTLSPVATEIASANGHLETPSTDGTEP